MIDKAIQIVEREWENIRCSFEMCGDIGDFNPENPETPRWLAGQDYEGFISNMIEMDKKLSRYAYSTSEASNVFTILASMAAEKLGLDEELAYAFGKGYGFIRTGFVAYNRLEPKQILFCKMFYPMGVSFNRDFDPSSAEIKLKIIFDRFMDWQNNPKLYTQDFAQFQRMGETWKEWNEVNA
jgi:hypothetical protein